MQLSLITINTWKCDGEYAKRLELLTKDLRHRGFDFLLAQEVFDSEIQSTEKTFSNQLDLPAFYEKSRYKKRTIDDKLIPSHSGLCTWTTHTISSFHRITLPSIDDDGERISQLIIYETGGMLIAIVNTHLTHLKSASQLRLQQMEFTLNEVHQICSPNGIIFCGDFNSSKQSTEIRNLISFHGFVDAFPGCLSTHVGGNCIDHVFYYPSHLFSVDSAITILDKSVNGLLPSDHCGIQVKLNIHTNEE